MGNGNASNVPGPGYAYVVRPIQSEGGGGRWAETDITNFDGRRHIKKPLSSICKESYVRIECYWKGGVGVSGYDDWALFHSLHFPGGGGGEALLLSFAVIAGITPTRKGEKQEKQEEVEEE